MFRKPFVWSILGSLSLVFATPAMAQNRVSASQKGSLLIFSKVEIRWTVGDPSHHQDPELISDTFLDMSNDADSDGVDVQAYFINGDRGQDNICHGNPCDPRGTDIVQSFEPGWNTADCRFRLTKNQPHYWSAAHGSSKCQSFTVLDMDGPGRLDPNDAMQSRILRGYVVMWAVKFDGRETAEFPNGLWREIRWNHLKGDALILNYVEGTAWEYNAWAFQAHCPTTVANVNGCFLDGPGVLDMDGKEYDFAFDQLLLDFYATSAKMALSSDGVTVDLDTELTLHPVDVDLRQDNDGPVLTKADFSICNENESCFSNTRRCICCWDSTNLSSYSTSSAIPNHFLRSNLGTDKGSARISSNDPANNCNCNDSCGVGVACTRTDAALLGVAVKRLTFKTPSISGPPTVDVATAGMNLVGIDAETALIRVDTPEGSGELRDGGARTSFSRGSDKAGSGKGTSTSRDNESRGTGETRGE